MIMDLLYFIYIHFNEVVSVILILTIIIGLIFYIKETLNERNDDSNR